MSGVYLRSHARTVDNLMKQEFESRIQAYEQGNLKNVTLVDAFSKYRIDAN